MSPSENVQYWRVHRDLQDVSTGIEVNRERLAHIKCARLALNILFAESQEGVSVDSNLIEYISLQYEKADSDAIQTKVDLSKAFIKPGRLDEEQIRAVILKVVSGISDRVDDAFYGVEVEVIENYDEDSYGTLVLKGYGSRECI